MTKRIARASRICASALALLASAGFSAADEVDLLVEAARTATERFADVDVALAEGYVPDPHGICVSAAAEGLPAELGAMGIHYLRPDLLGITGVDPRVDGTGTHTDFATPSILIYEPQADGSLQLVAVENLVFEAAWRGAGNTEPPALAGRTWDYMADDAATPGDEAHGFMPHWDQHIWLVENPAGALLPFNPAVTCEHQAGSRH